MADHLQGPSSDPTAPVDLTVIVPCHNEEATLPASLDALVAERWDRPWTILVVDNASTDGTVEVCRRYADRGVRVLSATDGASVAYARNAGARAATTSRSVAFCDGDDIVHPGWVAAIGDALVDHDLVGGRVETESLNPGWLANARPMGTGDRLADFAGTPFVPGGCSGMRRTLFDQLDGYDEAFDGLEDVEFSLRAAAAGVVPQYAPGAVLAYRLRADPRSVWRQAQYYGGGRPLLIRTAARLGLPTPSRFGGWTSWGWIIRHLPSLRHKAGRYQVLWVLGYRLAVLRRSIQLRSLYV